MWVTKFLNICTSLDLCFGASIYTPSDVDWNITYLKSWHALFGDIEMIQLIKAPIGTQHKILDGLWKASLRSCHFAHSKML